MATVYLARDLRHQRQVAIKVLNPDLVHGQGAKRFLVEVGTTAQLTHPHIVPLYDSGEAGDLLWYVMPYVKGESLRQRLQRDRELPVDDALNIAREVADALAYAHALGVIHRDIKPENILLSDGHSRVADFGIARAVQKAAGDRLTASGTILGTAAYMSPEQASNDRLDQRSDIYSLGCVLYEMLVGEPPFTGPTPSAIIARKLTQPVPRLRLVREGVPERVEQTVTKALARSPADRYATAAEFAGALAADTTGEPRTNYVAPATRLPAADRPARNTLIAVTSVVLLIISAIAAHNFWAEPNVAADAPRKMLAVLPFENLGQPEDEYFANGMTEELTSRLASLHGLGVISRTSANQYKKTSKSLKQIGRELGVEYLLEGSVRWEKGARGAGLVRVTPQLIKVSDDSHVWASSYNADLADVFTVQAGIAEEVARALSVALGAGESKSLNERLTRNPDAYDAYLRGLDYERQADAAQGSPRLTKLAEEMFSRAVQLDSSFAVAYGKLAYEHVLTAIFIAPGDQNEVAAYEKAVRRALRLDPTLPEAHMARAVYLWYLGNDRGGALRELSQAHAARPNDVKILSNLGVLKVWLGKISEGFSNLTEAVRLDPRSADVLNSAATVELYYRRYAAVDRYGARLISLFPGAWDGYQFQVQAALYGNADTARARQTMDRAMQSLGRMTIDVATYFPLLGREYQRRFERLTLSEINALQLTDSVNYYESKATLFEREGRPQLVRAYSDSVRLLLARPIPQLGSVEFRLRASRAAANARLGRRDDVRQDLARMAQLTRAVENPSSTEAAYYACAVARTHAMVGDTESALSELERCLTLPSGYSGPYFRLVPEFDVLRSDPRFQRIVTGQS